MIAGVLRKSFPEMRTVPFALRAFGEIKMNAPPVGTFPYGAGIQLAHSARGGSIAMRTELFRTLPGAVFIAQSEIEQV